MERKKFSKSFKLEVVRQLKKGDKSATAQHPVDLDYIVSNSIGTDGRQNQN